MAISYVNIASTPTNGNSNATSPTAITPPTMQTGDLVVVICQNRLSSDTHAVSQAGGQTWTKLTTYTNADLTTLTWFYCRYNGSWSANPSFSHGGTNNTCTMLVFRPTSGYYWKVDVSQSATNFAAPTTPFDVTVTGITAGSDSVAIASWSSRDDNSWAYQSGTSWTQPTGGSINNLAGQDSGQLVAYRLMPSGGSTGSPVGRETTVAGDSGIWSIMSFQEYLGPTSGSTAGGGANTVSGTLTAKGKLYGLTAGGLSTAVSATGTLKGSLQGVSAGGASIIYGLMYNYKAITNASVIANTGWHVATYTEYSTLCTFLGGTSVAGGKLKEVGATHWKVNSGTTNSAKFNGRGVGYRGESTGNFNEYRETMRMMASTKSTYVDSLVLYSSSVVANLIANWEYQNEGCSVRLLKDSTTLSDGQEGTYRGNDGRVYKTICIGTQEWMAENLMETKYRDGSTIPEKTLNADWIGDSVGAMCAYKNDWANVASSGTVSGTLTAKGSLKGTITTYATYRIPVYHMEGTATIDASDEAIGQQFTAPASERIVEVEIDMRHMSGGEDFDFQIDLYSVGGDDLPGTLLSTLATIPAENIPSDPGLGIPSPVWISCTSTYKVTQGTKYYITVSVINAVSVGSYRFYWTGFHNLDPNTCGAYKVTGSPKIWEKFPEPTSELENFTVHVLSAKSEGVLKGKGALAGSTAGGTSTAVSGTLTAKGKLYGATDGDTIIAGNLTEASTGSTEYISGSIAAVNSTFSDDFNSYANGSDLGGQGNWICNVGVIKCNGTQIYPSSTGIQIAYQNTAIPDKQYAKIDIPVSTSSKHMGVIVRANADSGGNGYVYFKVIDYIHCGKIVNGTYTEFDNHLLGNTEVYNLRIEVSGTTVSFYLNGILDYRMDGTNGGAGRQIDSDLTSGYVGIYGKDSSTSRYGDNWEGGVLPQVSGTLLAKGKLYGSTGTVKEDISYSDAGTNGYTSYVASQVEYGFSFKPTITGFISHFEFNVAKVGSPNFDIAFILATADSNGCPVSDVSTLFTVNASVFPASYTTPYSKSFVGVAITAGQRYVIYMSYTNVVTHDSSHRFNIRRTDSSLSSDANITSSTANGAWSELTTYEVQLFKVSISTSLGVDGALKGSGKLYGSTAGISTTVSGTIKAKGKLRGYSAINVVERIAFDTNQLGGRSSHYSTTSYREFGYSFKPTQSGLLTYFEGKIRKSGSPNFLIDFILATADSNGYPVSDVATLFTINASVFPSDTSTFTQLFTGVAVTASQRYVIYQHFHDIVTHDDSNYFSSWFTTNTSADANVIENENDGGWGLGNNNELQNFLVVIASSSPTAIVSGNLQAQSSTSLRGTTAGVATTVSGTLLAKGKLYGSTAGIVGTSSGVLKGKGKLYGSVAGTSPTVSATPRAKGKLYGSTAGTSPTVSATPRAKGKLYGSTAGTSPTVSGTIKAKGKLYGSTAGTNPVSAGTLHGHGKLAGLTDGKTTTAGAVYAKGAGPHGITGGVAGVSATLQGHGKLYGQTAGTSPTVSATGKVKRLGSCRTDGKATVSGTLHGHGKLTGLTGGATTDAGVLHGHGKLAGAVNNNKSLLGGTLGGEADLNGLSAASTLLAGVMHGHGKLFGTTTGRTIITGDCHEPAIPGQCRGYLVCSGSVIGRMQGFYSGYELLSGNSLITILLDENSLIRPLIDEDSEIKILMDANSIIV